MKPWIYKHLLLLVLLGLVSTATYAGERKEFSKTIKKEFEINPTGEIEISNQFGKVDIKTWDKKRAKFAIVIIVRADSEGKAQDIFDRIEIDFSKGNNYVKAVTEIASQKNSWWTGWNNNCDYSINYEVFIPKTVKLDIQNKHGDTYITEMDGNADLDIAHGNITADGFSGDLDLEMAHGNGTIMSVATFVGDISHSNLRFKKIGDVNLETAHCQIDLGDAKKIKLDSRHSNFEMGDIDELRADSRHDHFEIESVNSVFSESSHSIYEIDKVLNVVDFDFSHGGATIDYLEKGFNEVSLYGSHAGFKIRVADAANYDLDASGSHAGIRYPVDMDVSFEKDKDYTQEVKGSRSGSGNKGFIKARLSHGSLKIR